VFIPGVTYQMIAFPADGWPQEQLEAIRRLIVYECKSQALSRGEIRTAPGQVVDLPAGPAAIVTTETAPGQAADLPGEPVAARNKATVLILGAAALFFILRR